MDTFFVENGKTTPQFLLKKWLDNILYLPEVKKPTTESNEIDATPASKMSDYSNIMQSNIGSNLREIQQEEEIIFFDDVPAFGGKP